MLWVLAVDSVESLLLSDKQQEIDIPTLKVEENDPVKEKENQKEIGKHRPMTQITGVRKLKHTNSFTGSVPQYGVDTPHQEELGKVGNPMLLLDQFYSVGICLLFSTQKS